MKKYFQFISVFLSSSQLSIPKTFEIFFDFFLGKIVNSKFNFLLNLFFLKIYNFLIIFFIVFILTKIFFNNLILDNKVLFFISISAFISICVVFTNTIKKKITKINFLEKKIQNLKNCNISKNLGKKNYELSSEKIQFFINYNNKKKNYEINIFYKYKIIFFLNAFIFLYLNYLFKINKPKKYIQINLNNNSKEISFLKKRNNFINLIRKLFLMNITNFNFIFLKLNTKHFFLGISEGDLNFTKNFYYYLQKKITESFLEKKYKIKFIEFEINNILSKCKKIILKRYLTTAYFFNGIGIGNPLNSRHGYGKWKLSIQDQIQNYIENKTIIDFGSNCCILPLYLSYEGKAKQIDCVELHKDNCEIGYDFKKILEYQTSKNLKLNIYNDDMYKFIKENNKKYDVATFFCSLYYLKKSEIREIINILSKRVKILIIQANQQTKISDRAEKSNINYLKNVVEKNNFKIIKTFNKKNLVRPLFVAKSVSNE